MPACCTRQAGSACEPCSRLGTVDHGEAVVLACAGEQNQVEDVQHVGHSEEREDLRR